MNEDSRALKQLRLRRISRQNSGIATTNVNSLWMGYIGATYLTFTKKAKEFTSCHEVHDHIQVIHILKGSPEVDEKWVSNPHQHLSFRIGVFNLLHLDNLLLVQNLNGIEATVVA